MSVDDTVAALLASREYDRAAETVIRDVGPKMLGLVQTLLRDDDLAADAFSLFCENLWRSLPGFQGRSSFRTWAYRLAWNAALTVRDEGWRRLGRRLETTEAGRLAEEVRTASALRLERRRTELERLRATLASDEQLLLSLRLDEELSWDDIAEVMSRPGEPVDPATLRKRFERLKERLARLAREQGLLQ